MRRGVLDHPGQPVAVVALAPILPQEHPGVTLEAVLAVLAGAVLADLAVGDGGVVLGRALAAVVDRRVDDEPGRPAEERLGAAALELTDAGRGELRRAGLDAVPVQQIPAIAALQERTAAVGRGGKGVKRRLATQNASKHRLDTAEAQSLQPGRRGWGGAGRPLTTRQVSPEATRVQKWQCSLRQRQVLPVCEPVWIRRPLQAMDA